MHTGHSPFSTITNATQAALNLAFLCFAICLLLVSTRIILLPVPVLGSIVQCGALFGVGAILTDLLSHVL